MRARPPSARQRKKKALQAALNRIDWYRASTAPTSELSPAREWGRVVAAIRAYGRVCAALARAGRT